MTKESVRQKKAAMIAILAVLLTAFAPFIALGGDVAADGSADLSVYRYTPKLTMTSPNFGDVEYMVWDFGDGTVLDVGNTTSNNRRPEWNSRPNR